MIVSAVGEQNLGSCLPSRKTAHLAKQIYTICPNGQMVWFPFGRTKWSAQPNENRAQTKWPNGQMAKRHVRGLWWAFRLPAAIAVLLLTRQLASTAAAAVPGHRRWVAGPARALAAGHEHCLRGRARGARRCDAPPALQAWAWLEPRRGQQPLGSHCGGEATVEWATRRTCARSSRERSSDESSGSTDGQLSQSMDSSRKAGVCYFVYCVSKGCLECD